MYGSSSEEGVSYLRNRSRQYFLADASSAADDICELACSTSVEAKRLCGMRHVVAVLLVMAPVQALFVALILLAIPLLLFNALACFISCPNPLLLMASFQTRYCTKSGRLYMAK
jgi:hypothetical protein